MTRTGLLAVLTGLMAFIPSCRGGEPLEIPQIPTIKAGAGTAPASVQQGPPEEQYQQAYTSLTKDHIVVRRALGKNTVAVSEGMEDILTDLETMRSNVREPHASRLKEYIAHYQGIRDEFKRNRYSTAQVAQFDHLEQEVRREFAPDNVEFVFEAPARPQPAVKEPYQPPTGQNRPTAPPKESPLPPAADVPFWVVYKAWEHADRELREAYQKQQGGYEKLFQRLRESMALMKQRLPEADRPQVQYYFNEYERIYSSTVGFTSLPEGTTAQDVLTDLKNVSAVVSRTYNPDKK